MDPTVLLITALIQILAVIMIVYTFVRISQKKSPKLDTLEKYYLMRRRYEHLRLSLLFVVALIIVQLGGMYYYYSKGSLPLAQFLISDVIVIALVFFLSIIYKEREKLKGFEK